MSKPRRTKPSSSPRPPKAKKELAADELQKVTGGYQTGGSGMTSHATGGGSGAGRNRKTGA